MNKKKLWIPVLAGLMIGQLFAETDRPFKVVNTVRMGYNDNLYRNNDAETSFFMTDVIDLSFHAALSDRTDVLVKSQFNLLTDSGSSEFYPNLYAMLNHNVSPRLLLRLSDLYRSGETVNGRTNAVSTSDNERSNYFYNNASASADYVLTGKDRLQGSLSHEIQRHDNTADTLDWTTVSAGATWKRNIILQRTYSTLSVMQRWTEYDNRDSSYDATDLSAGISHAFNQEWQGNLELGVTQKRPDYPAPAANEDTLNPLMRAGLVYSPSPRTRFTGDFSHQQEESDDDSYGGQTQTELRFGAQHEITAKLMAKATARFANIEYASEDNEAGTATSNEEEQRMDLELRLTYKLNRMNFLELGVKHGEVSGDRGDDWEQNIVDIGWRVELN